MAHLLDVNSLGVPRLLALPRNSGKGLTIVEGMRVRSLAKRPMIVLRPNEDIGQPWQHP